MLSRIRQDASFPALMAGFMTFFIGISVSAVLVIQGAHVLGANDAHIASWFWATGLAIGLSGFFLSWRYGYPVATAWSTPGIAFIIASGSGYNLHEAIGAFLICGLAIAAFGFSGLFQKILKHIPQSLSCAMLAGILLKFGIAIFAQLKTEPWFILTIFAIYLISKRISTRYSIVITVIFSIILCPLFIQFDFPALTWTLTQPVWIQPSFSLSALFGLALPLFVINMTSQNLPGIGMIQSYGYTPHVNSLVGWTGIAHAVFAPFGAFSNNLAAISAAVSLDEQAHPDPKKRYIAGMSSGLCYVVMALFATTLTQLLMSFPHVFIVTLAGIALFGTISHNITQAFSDLNTREAALMTFLCSASGVQFLGIGSAFWGLIFGLIVLWVLQFNTKASSS